MMAKAEQSLQEGEGQEAWRHIRPVLRNVQMNSDDKMWDEVFTLAAAIWASLEQPELKLLAESVAKEANSPHALFVFGRQLDKHAVYEMAAAVLRRAHRLAPHEGGILEELIHALENCELHYEAYVALKKAEGLRKERFLSQYLFAFNAFVMGEMEETRGLLSELKTRAQLESDDKRRSNYLYMQDRLQQLVHRADVVRTVSSLDDQDLRGWHFVMTGGILLHISPYGFDEGMNGRYAAVGDTAALCKEGLLRLQAALQAASLKPARIWILTEDKLSMALGYAAAQMLRLPAKPWSADCIDQPGLVIAYDLSLLSGETLKQLMEHRPDQVLFAHAFCWTEDFVFVPDFVTYLYQFCLHPWDQRQLLEESTQAVTTPGTVQEWADEIVQATLEEGTLADLPMLQRFVAKTATASEPALPGFARSQGRRLIFRTDSHVKSNRYA